MLKLFTRWKNPSGWAFCRMMDFVDKLSDDDLRYCIRWLEEIQRKRQKSNE